jgi:hypothetical protein
MLLKHALEYKTAAVGLLNSFRGAANMAKPTIAKNLPKAGTPLNVASNLPAPKPKVVMPNLKPIDWKEQATAAKISPYVNAINKHSNKFLLGSMLLPERNPPIPQQQQQ